MGSKALLTGWAKSTKATRWLQNREAAADLDLGRARLVHRPTMSENRQPDNAPLPR